MKKKIINRRNWGNTLSKKQRVHLYYPLPRRTISTFDFSWPFTNATDLTSNFWFNICHSVPSDEAVDNSCMNKYDATNSTENTFFENLNISHLVKKLVWKTITLFKI